MQRLRPRLRRSDRRRTRRRERPFHLAGLRPAALGPLLLGVLLLSGGSLSVLLATRATSHQTEGTTKVVLHLLDQAWEGPLGPTFLALLLLATLATILDLALPWPAASDGTRYAALVSEGTREALEEVRSRVEACTRPGEEHISAVIDELLRGALRTNASDLHLSPYSGALVVTYRLDGVLTEVCRVPSDLGPKLATRIKVLAQLDTYARKPQDGALRRKLDADLIEARVSTLPVESGERVVLRITRGRVNVPPLGDLGFNAELATQMKTLLAKPQGLILVSGPVGSGKTTTLYAALQHLSDARGGTCSLVTLEDPIELQLPFATQTQINPHTQMSFAQTLRSVLRQDPNVLMLGEIRDQETAGIACQAGLSGHLILSTLHVDRAAGTFPRLLDMGVEPFVLASTVIGAMSQRLVRTLCTHCRRPHEPDGFTRQRVEALGLTLPEGTYNEPIGCTYCEGKGFTGRSPIGELLVVTEEVRHAVSDRAPTDALHQLALSQGMVPLLAAGLALASKGETSLAEVLRVVG